MDKYSFEINLPSQSSDPEHDTIADVFTKEDEVVDKIKEEDSAEIVDTKEDAERTNERYKQPTLDL